MVSARDLAQRYAFYLHTQLTGDDTEAVDFGIWLDEHWTDLPALPDEPCFNDLDGDTGSVSTVTWIEHGREIVGLLAGRNRGCYRVPIDARPPVIALFIDDAVECSTGSSLQERAFTLRPHEATMLPITIPIIAAPESRLRGMIVVTDGLTAPPAADATVDAPYGGLPS